MNSAGKRVRDDSSFRKTRSEKRRSIRPDQSTRNTKKGAVVGDIVYNNDWPDAIRPFINIFTKTIPSDEEIENEVKRVEKVTMEVLKEKDNLLKDDWDQMVSLTDEAKNDNQLVVPFEYKGPKHVVSKIPEPECKEPVLKLKYYVPLTRNIRAKDELQLSHMPYISKYMHDMSLINHFQEKFQNGIHGYKQNNFETSEELLYMTMKKLLPRTKNADLFYYALYKTFNNRGSQEELSELFPKLHRIYGGGEDLGNLEPWKDEEEPNDDSDDDNYESLGEGKRCIVRSSGIAGNGLFMGEDVKKGDYIGEYLGERCSNDETYRRAHLGVLTISYLYDLENRNGSLDADRAGNVFRFLNNSETPNCSIQYVKNGTRIAIYANEDIKTDTELTIDYGYSKKHQKILFNHGPSDRIPLMAKRGRKTAKKDGNQPGTSRSK